MRKTDQLDSKIDTVEGRLNGKTDQLDSKIDAVEGRLNAKIDAMGNRLLIRLSVVGFAMLSVAVAVVKYL